MHRTLATAMALLLLVSIAVIVVTGCGRPASPPPQTGQTPAPPQQPAASPSDLSRPAVTAAANALDDKNAEAFTATLSVQLRETVSGRLDLTGPGVPVLAKALREAKLVAEYPTVRIYETTVDGEKHSFYAVREEGQWRLAGL